MIKRILSIVLVALILILALPITSLAVDYDPWGTLQGVILGILDNKRTDCYTVSEENNIKTITLNKDIVCQNITGSEGALVFASDTYILDLNGHTINRNLTEATDEGNVINLSGGSLTITDSAGGGKITGGCNKSAGGGICVTRGTLTINSGTIAENSATDGGGIFIDSTGRLNMTGGTISDNTANNCGGGVNVQGRFYMEGGVIEHNSANPKTSDTYFGGGGIAIYKNGTATLSGGKIQYNSSTVKGGGILVLQANGSTSQNVSLTGVSITNNSAATGGGGIYYDNQYVTIELGGNTNINNNVLNGTITKTDTGYSLSGGTKNNLHFSDRSTNLSLIGDVKSRENVSVGITMLTPPGQFTSNGTSTDVQCFSSDNDNYKVKYNASGYLELKETTIADVLATNPNFPTSDSWEAVPDDAWENENGSTAHLATNALHLLYQDKGMSTDIKATVTSKNGNYIYTYDTTTVTFNMANNILESITVSDMSEKLDGTYKPVDQKPEPEPDPINYKVIEGANSTWVVEDGENPVFRSNADFSKFVRVELDGKVLNPANYTAKSGSTIIELKPEFAAKLAPGKHTINIVSTDGSAATVFFIDEAIANTDGFTLSEATMSSAFIAGSIIALTGVFFELKKKKVR